MDSQFENNDATSDSILTPFMKADCDTMESNPELWLSAYYRIESEAKSNTKCYKKCFKHFFHKCWQALNEDNKYSKAYAELRTKEAWFYSETSTELGRDYFKNASSTCRRIPFVHICFAQFELEKGYKSKAQKILAAAREFIPTSAELDEAEQNLRLGQPLIIREKIISKKLKLTRNVHDLDLSHNGRNDDSFHTNTFTGMKTPKTPASKIMSNNSMKFTTPLRSTENSNKSCINRSKLLLMDLKSPSSPQIFPSSVSKIQRFRTSNPTWSSVKDRAMNSVKPDFSEYETPPSNEKQTDSTNTTGTKPRRVLITSSGGDRGGKENSLIQNKENVSHLPCVNNKPQRVATNGLGTSLSSGESKNDLTSAQQATNKDISGSLKMKPMRIRRTRESSMSDEESDERKIVCSNIKEQESAKPVEAISTSQRLVDKKPVQSECKPVERSNKSEIVERSNKPEPVDSELCRIQAIINQANHVQPKNNEVWKTIEIASTSYMIMNVIGRGGSSKVFQAWNNNLKTIVAIKQVQLATCDKATLQSYLNEVEFLKRLKGNPYIIQLYAYEVSGKYLYLVMECGSGDLSSWLKTERAQNTLSHIDILYHWNKMLHCVDTIHKEGIIHLDLKPANFLLVAGKIKLIDFGIANAIQTDVTSMTKDTQFGTLNYMAPETINDVSMSDAGNNHAPKFKVGSKADVWSLGCILYLMMYGCTPFQSIRNQSLKLCAITNPEHQIKFPPYSNESILTIVKMCLQRNPKERPSVSELLSLPLQL